MEKKSPDRERMVIRAGVSPVESNKKIGPIRSHLYAYAFAKAEARRGKDAKIIFRIDDTDGEKHTKEAGRKIYSFFSEVLGMDFDVTPHNAQEKLGQSVFQSERSDFYQKALEELFDKKVAFVDEKSGLTLFDVEKFAEQYGDILQIEDLKIGEIKRSIETLIRGGTKFFPIFRSDKSALYHLASVVDDGEFGVTHVIRGQDKMSIVDFQEMVRMALDLQPKKYLHTPLLLDESGKMLGGKVKFEDFLRQGFSPHAIISYMISSGYGDAAAIYPSLDAFIDKFDYKKIHKSNGKFDLARLVDVNKRLAKETSEEIFCISFEIFLKLNEEKEMMERFEADPALRKAAFSLKKDFRETRDWLGRLIHPRYESLNARDCEIVERVIGALLKEGQISHAEEFGASKKEVLNAMRWVIYGVKEMGGIEVAFAYMQERGLVPGRLHQANLALLKEKKAAISPS